MPHHDRLDALLRHPHLWRAGQQISAPARYIPTGFPDLNRALGGGWPVGQLMELIIQAHGIGEFRLLMPAMAELASRDRHFVSWIMLVAPPHIPYAPALEAHGLNLSRLLVVRPQGQMDTLWAMEQALRSGTCAAVVAWAEVSDERVLRRLQLAAEAGSCWAALCRPAHAQGYRSPAALRIYLQWENETGALRLQILKQRGGLPGVVTVNL